MLIVNQVLFALYYEDIHYLFVGTKRSDSESNEVIRSKEAVISIILAV